MEVSLNSIVQPLQSTYIIKQQRWRKHNDNRTYAEVCVVNETWAQGDYQSEKSLCERAQH